MQQAAGIEKFLQWQAAAPMPCSQLVIGGVLSLNIPESIGDVVILQPSLGPLTGGAFRVTEKNHFSTLLLKLILPYWVTVARLKD